LITFHKILRGCEEGRRESWQLFLSHYTPIVNRWIAVYLPSLAGPASQAWRQTLRDLTANDFERLRSFDQQAEREFLLDLRAFLLERNAERLGPSGDSTSAPQPTTEAIRSLLGGLPLAHQQIVFLKLAGYSEGTIERIYGISPAVARQGLERLQAEYSAVMGRQQDVCPWPAAWCELLRQARGLKTESCPPLRQYVRMLDGQITWYEKDPMERHMSSCLHCLDRWAALREAVYWRREAKACPAEEIATLLSGLQLQDEAKPRKSLLKRILG
jgi:hypothetical protein